jgi:hypothetical protein
VLLTLGPGALDNLKPPIDRFQKLLAETPDEDRLGRQMLRTLLGELHYRAGHFKEADDFLARAADGDASVPQIDLPQIDRLLFSAMTAFKLGKAVEAGRALAAAKKHIEQRSPPVPDPYPCTPLLLAEAEHLLKGPTGSK